ncbi:zinc-binding protein A33-like [Rhinoraja longicauda]
MLPSAQTQRPKPKCRLASATFGTTRLGYMLQRWKVDELTQQVEWEFAELHQILNKEEHELKERLNARGEELLDSFNDRPASDSDQTVLQTIWNVLKEIMSPPSGHREETRHENHVVSNILAGEFGGPVQHVVWRQMRKSVKPVFSRLTLDVNSAHPRLVISPNLTAVCIGYGEQALPRSAKRFQNRACVLGSKKIKGGKHYWEVEVDQGAKWAVGVARESVGRQGTADLTVQNGYWVISPHRSNWLQSIVDFFAQTDGGSAGAEHLALQADPAKVGVYLDHEEGQVSFYDADNMSHLHTHSGPISGAVLPFFGPGLSTNNWMKLSQPWW